MISSMGIDATSTLKMLPLEMSCYGCPIVHFVYAASVTLRMLPSENRCTRKVIGFVHDFKIGYGCITDSKNVACGNELLWMPIVDFMYDAPMTLRMLPSENRCPSNVIGCLHDLNDRY